MHALVWKPRMHSKNQSLWSVLNYKLGSEDEVKKKANRQRFAMVTDKLKFCASGAHSESSRVLEALTDESGVWRDSLNAELVKRFPLTLMTRIGGAERDRERKKERKQGRKGERDRGRKHRERCRKEGREGGREPRMMRRSFKSPVWGQAFWLPLADHLAYLTLSPHLAWLRALCCVCVHLLAKMDSTTRVSGKLTRITVIWFPSRLWPPEEPFCTCVVQEVPWPQASEICGLFICYPSRTQLLRAPSIIFILQLSVHREQGTVAGPGTHLPPASVLSHVHVEQLRILSKWKDTVMPIPCQEVLLQ